MEFYFYPTNVKIIFEKSKIILIFFGGNLSITTVLKSKF